MKTTPTGLQYCPHCKQKIDTATDFEATDIPVPGDITLCGYCATILKFDNDMALMLCPNDEVEKLPVKTLVNLVAKQTAIIKLRHEYLTKNN